jgi:glucosamine--fructose-6-phosphate aminotransferase (isomerizing)
MCGIIGAIRQGEPVLSALVEGLRVLEYRGYDSAGIAVHTGQEILLRKKQGRLANLEEALEDGALAGASAGIGHTRWATHGPPSDLNAHPHMAGGGALAMVHNGIIENHQSLRQELAAKGIKFVSQTDSEVLGHLIAGELTAAPDEPLAALRAALARVEGYYAVALLLDTDTGPAILCARQGPPLVVAQGPGGTYLGSDLLALLPHSSDVVFLEDGDMGILTAGGYTLFDAEGKPVERAPEAIDWDPMEANKGPWPHHMLKEIHEQPDVLARTVFDRMDEEAGDVILPGLEDDALRQVERIQVVACGTALHAGLVTRYAIEELARVPVDVDFASEFRYRGPVLAKNTLALALTQSGETADTLAATRLCQKLGARVLAICNVQGASQVREADAVILTHAGPEIGVASTKAFTAQVAAGILFAIRLGRAKGTLSAERARELLQGMRGLRSQMEQLLTQSKCEDMRSVARRHAAAKGFLFIGRGINYPIALEGALKLKEISYVHAEGYAAGEMKHGPIALIDPGMTIVCLNGQSPLADKMRSNVEQVQARGGVVLSVGSDQATHDLARDVCMVPTALDILSPLLNVIPLQLFSYYIAEQRGCDIDKPRNLAKSVTVE